MTPKNQEAQVGATGRNSLGLGLRLEDQLCFPLYAASRQVIQAYKPYLSKLGLTYPQYLVMLVLWEHDGASVRQIGDLLRLDSPTLTLVLKKLAAAGLIRRRRPANDARSVINLLTEQGKALQQAARSVPVDLACQFPEEAKLMLELKPILDRLNALMALRGVATTGPE